LRRDVYNEFIKFKRNPNKFVSSVQPFSQSTILPIVDLDRLEPREIENLCFELLNQIGFKSVDWGKEFREFDVVATLPKKDPDGFEYNELWLISLGLRAPPDMFFDMLNDQEYLMHTLHKQQSLFMESSAARFEMPITMLLVLVRDLPYSKSIQRNWRRIEERALDRPSRPKLRYRIWDRQHLVTLIQQHPQIAHKYFSEDGRSQSKSRKSYEQLYLENASLNEKNQTTIAALSEERDKRVRAERDAVWKDVAFTAAHKLGNPIFAIETNLLGIKRKIPTHPDEALSIAEEMAKSIEKAKLIIEQFKSLTKAQQISPREVDLLPIINSASHIAIDHGVNVKISAKESQPRNRSHPLRLAKILIIN